MSNPPRSCHRLDDDHMTGRMLATRMKDHLNLRNPLTAVGEHCAHGHHKITKDNVRVLAREEEVR